MTIKFRCICLVAGIVCMSSSVWAWKGEAATFTTHNTLSNPTWQSIGFQQTYSTPPIVVTIPETTGSNPGTIRIRSVTTSGFENTIVEPEDNDGPHLAMSSAYLAVEPGIHVLPDGTVIEAGFITTSSEQYGSAITGLSSWETVTLGYDFGSPPTIIAALQTMVNEVGEGGDFPPAVSSAPWMTVAINGITGTQFDVALDRSESGAGSVLEDETIGYIAMAKNAGGTFFDNQNQSIQYLAETSAANIRGWSNGDTTHTYGTTFSRAPISLVTKNTRNNRNGGWLRRSGNTSRTRIKLRLDEDHDHDSERATTAAEAEAAGILSFSRTFNAEFLPGFTVEKSSVVISDPVNGTNNPKAIPGAVVEYTLLITNTGHDYSDSDNFEVSDTLPADTSLLVSDIPGGSGGPVKFDDGATSSKTNWVFSGLSSLTDSIDFSTNGTDFSYGPTADGQGADASVTHIKLKPQGAFAAYPPSHPTASYRYRVIIK
uniref:DUF11 domain-containing protein n=1 Tax=uncultured Thiotrichaceae bacterium TaxID=298394 RepID=A0A6S6SYB5_9GAMM|nr:MAG: Unknown protein [uncultured Thiotrichaceae bacterium]